MFLSSLNCSTKVEKSWLWNNFAFCETFTWTILYYFGDVCVCILLKSTHERQEHHKNQKTASSTPAPQTVRKSNTESKILGCVTEIPLVLFEIPEWLTHAFVKL